MADSTKDLFGQDTARGLLNSLLSDLPGVVYRRRHDAQWTMLGLTPKVEELTGRSAEELLRNAEVAFLDLIHPDDRAYARQTVEEHDTHGAYQVAYRIRRPDGEERWILDQGRTVEEAEDGPSVFTGYLQDVTRPWVDRLRQKEEEVARVRRDRRRLELLQEVTQIVNRERTLVAALRSALPALCESLGFAVGHVFLEGDDGPVAPGGVWHLDETVEGLDAFVEATEGDHWDPAEGLPGRVMRTRRAEWVEDVEGADDFLRVGPDRPSPVGSGVAVPVVSGERAPAVLELYSVELQPRQEDVVELLEQVGVQLGRVWEREESDRARHLSRQLYGQIAAQGQIAFWMSSLQGRILYLSPGYEAILGGDPGVSLESGEDLLELAHPDDRDELRELLETVDRAPYDIRYRVRTSDGGVRWIHQKGFPIRDTDGREIRVGGMAEDVTDEVRSRQALEEKSRLLSQTFASIDEAVLVIDTSGEGRGIVQVNEAAVRMFGWSREELLGGTTEKIHVDREHFLRFGAEGEPDLARTGVLRATYPLKRKDGTVFSTEQTVTLLNPEEGIAGGAVSVIRDVSHRESLQQQLTQAQKMEAVGRLAGGIAHDFNNLLTVVRGQADFVLLDLDPESPLVEELEMIRAAADRAAELTHQLLAFGREQVLRPRVVDLNQVVEGVQQLLRRVLGEDVEVRIEAEPDLPPVRVDPNQLEQVIVNLAVNARDAMPRGGTLALRTESVELTSEDVERVPHMEPGPAIRLHVSDTGVGMASEVRDQVFEPFFTTKSEQGGTGLGLSMSYGIIRQSGGSIHVESEPGEGTTFTVCLPAVEGRPESTDRRRPPERKEASVDSLVLVVEDDATVLRVTRRILERAGLRVRTASDTDEAWAVLEEEGSALDLLLTDLVLPGETGGRELVARVLRELPDLRVVVMSGYAEGSPGSREDLPPEVGFVAKPFTPEGLVAAVEGKLTE